MWGKNTPHNASYQIPLIIRDPNNRANAGAQIDAFTESIDLAPTLLDWANLPAQLAHNGRSLMDWVKGHKPENWAQSYVCGNGYEQSIR